MLPNLRKNRAHCRISYLKNDYFIKKYSYRFFRQKNPIRWYVIEENERLKPLFKHPTANTEMRERKEQKKDWKESKTYKLNLPSSIETKYFAMLIISTIRAAVAVVTQMIIKFSVKYLKNPSLTFINVKYSIKGIIITLPIVAKYAPKFFLLYKAAKQASHHNFVNWNLSIYNTLVQFLFYIYLINTKREVII